MKKMLLLAAVLFLSAAAFCEKRKLKPGANEAVIVGRIRVHIVDSENFDFYAKTWGVKDFSQPDRYVIFDDSYKEKYKLNFLALRVSDNGAYGIYSADEIFLSKRNVKKGTLSARSPIQWNFFSSQKFQIYLPLEFDATVPKGEKYIYVGDFDYYLEGSDFRPTRIEVSDGYDFAKEELSRALGAPAELCRVEIRAPSKK